MPWPEWLGNSNSERTCLAVSKIEELRCLDGVVDIDIVSIASDPLVVKRERQTCPGGLSVLGERIHVLA